MSVWKQKATNGGGGDYEVPPAGTHPAVLVAMVDLGTHHESYKGREYDARKVLLVWELTAEPLSGYADRNHVIGRQYTLSMAQKAGLRQMLEKWRGKAFGPDEEFDLSKILGQKCLLSVSHKDGSEGKVYAKVDGASAVPKGMQVPEPKHKPFMWDLSCIQQGLPSADWLPYIYGQPVPKVIESCNELAGRAVGAGVAMDGAEFDEDTF